jgi:MFS family permease
MRTFLLRCHAKFLQKVINIILVAVHASMSTFIAAAIIPAFEDIATDLDVSLQEVSYLTTLQIAILAIAPLIWKPFSNTYGRRPLFLLSLVGSLVGNVGCAKSFSYATMALCRAIVAFFISPAAAIGSAVVTEVFFKKDRARYVGIWTLMTILGVPIASLVMGFVATAVGYRWIYWILTIVSRLILNQ